MYFQDYKDKAKDKSTQSKENVCSVCNKSYEKKDAFKKHIYTGGKEKLKCAQCSKTFASKSSLALHTKVVHGEGTYPEKKKIVCEKCNQSFKGNYSFKRHTKTFH